jgi:Holliday junction resolvasome RuvABC DNA-binding subunit
VPREKGGSHDIENLVTLCESHHVAHHAGAVIIEGNASNPTIVRRAHNKFTIATREIETARALKALGFDKREVKEAVARARTHVGTTELSVEQWIKIALRYCPRPVS